MICLYEVMNSTLRLIENAKKFVDGYSMDKEGLLYLNVLSDIFQDEIQPCLKKAKLYK